jgi:hypothetical protein
MEKMINLFKLKPKNLFLIDGLGALLTAFFLFVILRTFYEYFGMPQMILTYLSVIALIFSFYSLACFFLLDINWRPFLRIISIANLLYCILTFGLVIYHHQSITLLGITYFLAEIILVCGLVFVELKILRTES